MRNLMIIKMTQLIRVKNRLFQTTIQLTLEMKKNKPTRNMINKNKLMLKKMILFKKTLKVKNKKKKMIIITTVNKKQRNFQIIKMLKI